MTHIQKEYERLVKLAGMDPVEWIVKTILPIIKKDESGLYIFPDPYEFFKRHSSLHSWYKHYSRTLQFIYPILRDGLEPGNFEDNKQIGELTWAFIREEKLFDDTSSGVENVYHRSKQPLDIMIPFTQRSRCYGGQFVDSKKVIERHLKDSEEGFDYYGDHPLYNLCKNVKARELTRMAMYTCQIVQNRILRLLLIVDPRPPGPTKLKIVRDPKYDKGCWGNLVIHEKEYEIVPLERIDFEKKYVDKTQDSEESEESY